VLKHIQLVIGIIAREQIDLAENLERVDDRKDRHEQDRRREIAQLDVEKLVAGRGALDLRDLQKRPGDVVERRHEEDHVVAEVLPQKQHHDDHHAVVGFEPVDTRRAEYGEKLVYNAVGVEQHLPDEDDRGDRHHHGAQEERAELALPGNAALEHERHQKRQHHRQRHRERRKDDGVVHRDLVGAVLEHIFVVLEAHEAVIHRARDKRVVDHDPEGDDIEQQHAEKARPRKTHRLQKVAELPVAVCPEFFHAFAP